MSHRFAIVCVVSALLVGCSSSARHGGKNPEGASPSGARAEYASRSGALVEIGTNAAKTRADASITVGDVVIWHNGTADRPLSVEIEGAIADGCATYGAAGFCVHGARTSTEPVLAPGAAASLAFPQAGTYSYAIHGLDAPVKGTVRVAAPPPPPTPTK